MERKKRKYLKGAELAAAKVDVRPMLDLPKKSYRRGEIASKLALKYGVSRSKIYDLLKSTHRSPTRIAPSGSATLYVKFELAGVHIVLNGPALPVSKMMATLAENF